MKNLKITEDVHAKLMMLKGVYGKKNMTEVIEKLLIHAGYTETWFDKMAELHADVKKE